MKIKVEKFNVYQFIADGMISISALGEGRPILCVILDKTKASEVGELCKMHTDRTPGDVETTWVRDITPLRPQHVILKIQFKNPIDLTFGISFNIDRHYMLIDGIIQSQMLILEVGQVGDKVSDMKNESILIEVQRMRFCGDWQSYLERSLRKKFKTVGVPKSQIKQRISDEITAMRNLFKFRTN
jgi:hypothetical protein